MKYYSLAVTIAFALAASAIISERRAQAQNTNSQPVTIAGAVTANNVGANASHSDNSERRPIFVTEIPVGYRDWKLISVAHEEGSLNDIRAILGNDIAINTYREGKLPFPDGAIIARIAWNYVPSEENNKIFGRSQSFVPGNPPAWYLQFMVKDSKKYAATGGWGYAQFDKDGKPAGEGAMTHCFVRIE